MLKPNVRLLYYQGRLTLPEEFKGHPKDRLASTPGDNLAEFAGRVCYDSVCKARGRPTPEYHAHVHETAHNSVYAHAVETFEIDCDGPVSAFQILAALQCRPGLWVTRATRESVRFCLSLRALLEWRKHTADREQLSEAIRSFLSAALLPDYPLALEPSRVTGRGDFDWTHTVRRLTPELPHEQWASLYVTGVSRDVLQELARHHYQTNFSVRSTRYVDEGDSGQVLHPAMAADPCAPDLARTVFVFAKTAYKQVFKALRGRGVSEKSARGAARSVLPGATETRLVFSLSKFQARHLLALRQNQATGAVDDEFRLFAGLLRATLCQVWADL